MNSLEPAFITSPYSETEECSKFLIDEPGVAYLLQEIATIDQEYTLSFWVKSESSGAIIVGGSTFSATTTWVKHSTTFKATSVDLSISFSAAGTYYLYQPKLEIGNKVTDWTPAPEDVDDSISDVNERLTTEIVKANTSIAETSSAIIMTALEEYVKTGDYEAYKETVSAQMQVLTDMISLKFAETYEKSEKVEGEMVETNQTLSKYFEFTVDGLAIKSGNSVITLHIDNDMIVFKKNGVEFGWWDGVDFHTGNIVVELHQRAQFGNFAFIPRSDGSLSFLKVGE